MIKHIVFLLILLITPYISFADNSTANIIQDSTTPESDIIPVSEILQPHDVPETKCASPIYARAMANKLSSANSETDENQIRTAIYDAFYDAGTLNQVLQCPEVATLAEDDTITFSPIQYQLPGTDRTITINYETQPKIIKQHLSLATRPTLPGGEPNPDIMTDGATWTNTDPAWYGIAVVRAGAWDEFVGTDKNNTISLKYIEDNIDNLYPQDACTDKTALTRDDRNLNKSIHKTVGIEDSGEKDSNDYYVAGDKNLQWIGYTELALDIAITVLTAGGFGVISAETKAIRAGRIGKNLTKSMQELRQTEQVADYIRMGNKISKAEKELDAVKALKEIDTITDEIKALDKAKDAKQILKNEERIKELEKLTHGIKNTDKLRDAKTLETEIEQGTKALKEMDNLADVKKYKEAEQAMHQLQEYRHALRGLRRGLPHRGNIFARAGKAFKAMKNANKTLRQTSRVARAGMKSGRLRDWLFHATLKGAGKLARVGAKGGLLFGALKIVGDMYDFTETSTGEFTNDVQFKPLLLLSADDLQGQENVVNYGMWLMWLGNSTAPADDDAAFLQAFDFAQKAAEDLEQYQTEHNRYDCEVDFYVVRPIIREPGSANPELYYLIMNEEPWRVRK